MELDSICFPSMIYGLIACVLIIVFIIFAIKKYGSSFTAAIFFYLCLSICCMCCIASCIVKITYDKCLQQQTSVAWCIACISTLCYLIGIIAGINQLK